MPSSTSTWLRGYIPVIPALGRWSPEDQKFKVILNYIEFEDSRICLRPCQKNQPNKKTIKQANKDWVWGPLLRVFDLLSSLLANSFLVASGSTTSPLASYPNSCNTSWVPQVPGVRGEETFWSKGDML